MLVQILRHDVAGTRCTWDKSIVVVNTMSEQSKKVSRWYSLQTHGRSAVYLRRCGAVFELTSCRLDERT